jgi:hypothetical protein
MRRGFMIGFVVLGLTACGQGQQGSAESQPGSPSAAGNQAAKPDVSAGSNQGSNQDATSCLDLVASANYSDAVPVCTRALNMDQNNEKVRTALQTANAKVAEGAAAAAAGAADAAQDASDKANEAAEAAKGAGKTY